MASIGRADDCADWAALDGALSAARDAVDDARSGISAQADLAPLLASAGDALQAADAAFVGAVSPGAVVPLRKRIRADLATSKRAVARAAKRPGRTRAAARRLARARRFVAKAAALFGRVPEPDGCGVALNGALGATEVFPSDNWWNVDVRGRAPLANSDAIIDFIGRTKPLHADFGTTFGIPYVVLDAPRAPTELTFRYDDESDHAAPGEAPGYPIPAAARATAGFIEGGVAGGGPSGDRHLILVDRTRHLLFETYATRWTGTAWAADSGAIFDLTSNVRRPDGWTSADAAGLAIFPGLVRADEVFDAGEIRHALRFTVRATQGYVFPASHDATHGSGGDLRPPLGLRVRLKSTVDVSAFSAPVRVILTAMQRYGLILADNGSDWFVTGAPDPRWDDETVHDEFAQITGDDFEAIE